MKDEAFYILRALSLGLCVRRISIMLILSKLPMGIMKLTKTTGQYRQLITSDLKALLKKQLVAQQVSSGRIKTYETTPVGVKVLEILTQPIEFEKLGVVDKKLT